MTNKEILRLLKKPSTTNLAKLIIYFETVEKKRVVTERMEKASWNSWKKERCDSSYPCSCHRKGCPGGG